MRTEKEIRDKIDEIQNEIYNSKSKGRARQHDNAHRHSKIHILKWALEQ